GRQRGISQLSAQARPDRLAVEGGRLTGDTEPALAQDWLVNQAKDRETVNDQRDEGAESGPPGEEGASAVDRVEHPLPAGAALRDAEFLAMNAVLRNLGGEQPPHCLLGFAIGNGDRRRVAFAFGCDGLAEMRPDRSAGGIGQAMGKGDLGREIHGLGAPSLLPASMLSGSPSSCTRMTMARMPSAPARGV